MLTTNKPVAIIGLIAAILIQIPRFLWGLTHDWWAINADTSSYAGWIILDLILEILTLVASLGVIALTFAKVKPFIALASYVVLAFLALTPTIEVIISGFNYGAPAYNLLLVIPGAEFLPLFGDWSGSDGLYIFLTVLRDLSFYALLIAAVLGFVGLRGSATSGAGLSGSTGNTSVGSGDYVPATRKSVGAVILSLLIPIVGLIMGYVARNEINQSGGQLRGAHLAKAAIVIGWIYTIAGVLYFFLALIIGITAAASRY